LGKLSPEEKAEQARKGHRDAGQALAQKWLDSSQRLDIAAELNKYPQRERDSIKQALIEHLVEGAELTTTRGVDNAKKVARAISSLKPELEPRAAELDQLVQEYEKAEQKISQELDTTRRQRLHQLRISGTAVDTLNIEASPRWRLAREKLLETFTPRLNDLKQSLGR